MSGWSFRVPIAFKLVLFTVVLLLLTTALIANISYNHFEKTSRDREESFTENNARSKADEVESQIEAYKDKVGILASLVLKRDNRRRQLQEIGRDDNADATLGQDNQAIQLALSNDKDIINVEVYEKATRGVQLVAREINAPFLDSIDQKPESVKSLRKRFPFPYAAVLAGTVVVRNSSHKSGLAVITLGFPLVVNEYGKISHIVVADINLARIQSAFNTISASTIFLIDNTGTVLAHPEEELAIERKNLASSPIVQSAIRQKQKRFQTLYTDPRSNERFIAAYAKTKWGVSVIAQVPEKVVLEPAKFVQREAFFVAGQVLSIAIFIVFVFSITLTSPIERLVDLTLEIAKGNFNVDAKKAVRSKDEVGDLANAFDEMTVGLKERDKVKNLFSKFHGSSVAEDLIENDVAVGGSNKTVTVFFSDIRGFTAFSENRTPEEVVDMLNEYFERMVTVINRNNGIVDKFIGDAIMAVWGAPQSTGEDAKNAIRACLQMRQSLDELNSLRVSRNQIPIKIGMGLHSGDAISGTIGSEERMEYTVIGDTVNMASRIEASTKAFGTDLLISEITARQVGEDFLLEEAGVAEVKGKSEPLKMYKVRGYFDEAGEPVEIKTDYSDYQAESADKVKIA